MCPSVRSLTPNASQLRQTTTSTVITNLKKSKENSLNQPSKLHSRTMARRACDSRGSLLRTARGRVLCRRRSSASSSSSRRRSGVRGWRIRKCLSSTSSSASSRTCSSWTRLRDTRPRKPRSLSKKRNKTRLCAQHEVSQAEASS